MKLAVGSDKAGYELKEQVKAYLCKNGHEVEDLGTENPQIPSAYYEAAHNVCVHIRDGKAEGDSDLRNRGRDVHTCQ